MAQNDQNNKEFLITHTQWDQAQVTPKSLQNLLENENVQRILHGFWERQITSGPITNQAIQAVKEKRQRLIKWMFEVCVHSKCEIPVLPHAIKLLDRFLSITPCKDEHLQAVGAASILLASKFRETTPLGIKRLSQLTQGAVSENMIRDVEMVTLMKLKWDISCATYVEFLPFIFDILDSSIQEQVANGDQEYKRMSDLLRSEEFRSYVAKYIDKLAALCYWSEPDLITKPPSVIAVQCVSVFFKQQNYLTTRMITSALTSYIPTLSNKTDMDTCWETATQVWAGYATAPRSQRTNQRPAQPTQRQPPRRDDENSRSQNRPNSHNPLAKHNAVENPAAMDSGNYSGE
jgi:hypothetical protein